MNAALLKKIKAYLQDQPELKFNGLSRSDVGNKLKTFGADFFKHNVARDTVYASNGKVQTTRNKRRSIGDIYRIFYYYFPKIRLSSVYKIMLEHIQAGHARSHICHSTHLRVYLPIVKDYEAAAINGDPVDEFGININEVEGFEKCQRDKGWGAGDKAADYIVKIKV